MKVLLEDLNRLRMADPDNPPSPVPVPEFYAKEFDVEMRLNQQVCAIGSPLYVLLADSMALRLRAKDRRRLAWLKTRDEFVQLAAGNARLVELFDMAANAPPGGC